jgi:serine/threonine protein kinase
VLPVHLPDYRSTIKQIDLPTKLEIENAITKLPCICDPRFVRVIAINNKYVVKYGSHVSENEGNALLYLERELDIPAPRLYAMYREDGQLYIVMEFLQGKELPCLWPTFSPEDKTDITTQLCQILELMRALPSPGTLGNVNNGPLPHRFFFVMPEDPQINRPFDSGKELALALALHSRRNWAIKKLTPSPSGI